jgi:hypothetical protein
MYWLLAVVVLVALVSVAVVALVNLSRQRGQ